MESTARNSRRHGNFSFRRQARPPQRAAGTNPPVRLDAIKGNKIPFAGFRTATKVVNAKTGARENAALVLRSLASPDGKLDAKALLNASKSMQTHLNRLGTMGAIRGTMTTPCSPPSRPR